MLGLWKPEVWQRFTRTRLGRLVWTQRCARTSRVPVAAGYAVVFAGYTRPPKRCGSRRPNRYLAHVYLGSAVVSINIPFCFRCVYRGRGSDPYDSAAGMRRIVKSLRLRPVSPAAR